jgi:hypothetical protein
MSDRPMAALDLILGADAGLHRCPNAPADGPVVICGCAPERCAKREAAPEIVDERPCEVCGGAGEVCPCGGPPCQTPPGRGCGVQACPKCGEPSEDIFVECPTCGGDGGWESEPIATPDGPYTRAHACPECHGECVVAITAELVDQDDLEAAHG